MATTCAVPGCNAKKKKGLSYHYLPRSDDRRKQWLRVIKNPRYVETTDPKELLHVRVCSQHFKDDDFRRNFMAEMMPGKGNKKAATLLKDDAVPSVFPHPSASLALVKRSTEVRMP